jgi:hypothetical protein
MAEEHEALGWAESLLLRRVRILSTTADMAVVVDHGRLARRWDLHPTPCTDGTTLTMWEQVEGVNGPPSPVRLVGVVFDKEKAFAGEGLPLAWRWRGFAPTAARLSEGRRNAEELLSKARRYGVGAVLPDRKGGWKQVVPAGPRTTPKRSGADRLIEEHLYARLVRDDLVEKLLVSLR